MLLHNIIPVIFLIYLSHFEKNEALNWARFFWGIQYMVTTYEMDFEHKLNVSYNKKNNSVAFYQYSKSGRLM